MQSSEIECTVFKEMCEIQLKREKKVICYVIYVV